MKEFYEPMIYMSTPEHPNTMGALVVLKEEIDGDILRDVVEELRVRFPYFYIKVVARDNDLSPEPNPLPMTVRNTWEPINFNSEESNYHLAAWKYEGKRMSFEISHSLTDGAGFLPYIKSALYLYLSRKTKDAIDPAGFRLPGDEIPESETGNPFSDLDIDSVEAPLYSKPPVPDFFRLNDGTENVSYVNYIKLSEDELMQYCKDFDGSPNAFISVMLARSARRFCPDNEKTICISVAIDHKAMLGNNDNYRLFANVIELDFPKDRSLEDLMKACTTVRGQMLIQAQPENSLWTLKQRKLTYEKLGQVPLEMKLGMIAKSAGSTRWSMSVSYANSRSFGPLDPYIEEFYCLSEPGVSDIICEITCINKSFFLAIGRNFTSEKFIEIFLDELSSVGVSYELMGNEPFRLCGVESYNEG